MKSLLNKITILISALLFLNINALQAQSLHYISDRSFGTSFNEAKPIGIQIGSKYFETPS